uniref:Lysophosphatidic acid receptor 1 n=1 Tax=Eptatretus burgeri TaxID=7764 RepID=A0A8C4QZN0_EPTBU
MGECHYHENVSYFYHQVGKHLASSWEPLYLTTLIVGIPLSLFICFSNLLVMVAVYLNQRFHLPIYYLIANLAAADCFAGISYLYSLAHTGPNTQLMSKGMWFLRQSLIDISLSASVANLLAIAWERHFTISGMQLQSQMSARRVVFVIIMIWVIAIFMGTLPLYWNCICNLTICSNMAPLFSNNYILFWAISNLLIMVYMLVLYMRIFCHVQSHVHRMSRNTVSGNIRIRIFTKIEYVRPCHTPNLSHQISSGSVHNFLRYPVHKQTERGENNLLPPLVEEVKTSKTFGRFSVLCSYCCENDSKGATLLRIV